MGSLSEYEDKYLEWCGLSHSNFVETGCYKGEGLRVADKYFTNLISCDISKKYTNKCKTLFPHAIIVNKNSILFLKEVCSMLVGKTVFWLDAHYPNQYDLSIKEDEENKFPLYEELEIIKTKRNYEDDIILCDDLRVIQSEDNPVKGELGVRNLKDRHMVHDKTFSEFVSILSDTHYYELVGLDGLIFIPHPRPLFVTKSIKGL